MDILKPDFNEHSESPGRGFFISDEIDMQVEFSQIARAQSSIVAGV